MELLEFSKAEFLGIITIYIFILFLTFKVFYEIIRSFIDIWK